MNFTPRPTLTGTAVTLRNPEPRDVAFRLALGFDPAIAHMFGVDPNASDTVPALLPPTEATVEQWLDAIAKHVIRADGVCRLNPEMARMVSDLTD